MNEIWILMSLGTEIILPMEPRVKSGTVCRENLMYADWVNCPEKWNICIRFSKLYESKLSLLGEQHNEWFQGMVGVRIRAQKAGQTQELRKLPDDWQNLVALLSELWAFLLHRTVALAHFHVSVWLWFLWISKLKKHGNGQGGDLYVLARGQFLCPFYSCQVSGKIWGFPSCNLNMGCYFVASFFQTLSVSNLKWAGVNCSNNKRSIILSLRALVTLYLQRKTRLLALTLIPTTL